jgi:hypothetical protein
MFDVKAQMTLWALKGTERSGGDSSVPNKVEILTIEGDVFNEIIDTYPEIKNKFLMRAIRRKTHFEKHFKEIRNIYLLLAKTREEVGQKVDDDTSNSDMFNTSAHKQQADTSTTEGIIDSLITREFKSFKKDSIR